MPDDDNLPHAPEGRDPAAAFAWLLPVAAVLVALTLSRSLTDAGTPTERVMVTCFYLGVAGGWTWQLRNPRDVVDRLAGWAFGAVAVMALLLVPGEPLEVDAAALAVPGIAVGVLTRAGWARRRGKPHN